MGRYISNYRRINGALSFLALSFSTLVSATSNYVEFSDSLTLSAEGNVSSVVAGRFDSSNNPGIAYVAKGTLYYRSGNGDQRSFGASTKIDDGHQLQKVWAEDVSGDGYDDLVLIDGTQTVYTFIAKPDETPPFHSYHTTVVNPPVDNNILLPDGEFPMGLQDLTLGDFDNDGDIDLGIGLMTVAISRSSSVKQPTQDATFKAGYAIAKNDGASPLFPSSVNPIQTNGVLITSGFFGQVFESLLTRITAGDFNGDGFIDLAVCYHNLMSMAEPNASVFPGNGKAEFGPQQQLSYNGCQDIDGFITEGDAMGQVPPVDEKALLVLGFNSDGRILEFASDWSIAKDQKVDDTTRGPMGQSGDYNRDGRADLLFTNGNSSLVQVGWGWDNWNDYSRNADLHLGTDIQTGDGSDFDHDGLTDIVGADGSDIFVYFNETQGDVILLFAKNDCGGDAIGQLSGSSSGTYDLTDDDMKGLNDEIRSLQPVRTKAGTVIKVYDSSDGSTDDDWAKISITKDVNDVSCVDTFEENVSEYYFDESYSPNTGFSISANALDGKISRIQISTP